MDQDKLDREIAEAAHLTFGEVLVLSIGAGLIFVLAVVLAIMERL